ncbi:MAG TPA: hypothetical protein VMK84_17185 [Streptosporangiaceae bacterium]|nr:hypothetical protein [Streptosporangiaceae bacterium]
MFGFILALNVAGWGIYLMVVMPHHFDYRGAGNGLGHATIVMAVGAGITVAARAWWRFGRVEARWTIPIRDDHLVSETFEE